MTLRPYPPEKLDQLALRFFDLAAEIRSWSKAADKENPPELLLHDKKALQWCENLEEWAKKTQLTLEIQIREAELSKKKASHSPGRGDAKSK
jgi:hypothetical protein